MKTLAWVIWGIASLVAVAWLTEALTIGRGFISTYIAPVAFLGFLLSTFLHLRADANASK